MGRNRPRTVAVMALERKQQLLQTGVNQNYIKSDGRRYLYAPHGFQEAKHIPVSWLTR
jgi:hypothetical protein